MALVLMVALVVMVALSAQHCPPDLSHTDGEVGGHDHGLRRTREIPGQPG